ncbi:MAG: glutathione binding-like protein [Minicystis sp.]
MKVFGHPMSTCTRKVLTTLAEKGHEAEFVMVDIMKGEAKAPAHLARQPFGVVPAIDDDGFVLYEARAIIAYLNDKLSGPALVPADIKERALMNQWLSVEYSYVSGTSMKIVMQMMFGKMAGKEPDMAVVNAARDNLRTYYGIADKWLANHEFFGGKSLSIADISWMPYMQYVNQAGSGDLIAEQTHLAAWWKRVSTRPSWVKVAG